MKIPIEAPDNIAAAIAKPGVIAANAIASTISGAAAGRVRVTTSGGPARDRGNQEDERAEQEPDRTLRPDADRDPGPRHEADPDGRRCRHEQEGLELVARRVEPDARTGPAGPSSSG